MPQRRYHSAPALLSPVLVPLACALLLASCGVSDQLERADALARQHRWTEAVEAYKAVIREYPNSYDAAWGIARIYCQETHHAEPCLRWTERLLLAYPNDERFRLARALGLRDRAKEYRERGDTERALADEAEAARLE